MIPNTKIECGWQGQTGAKGGQRCREILLGKTDVKCKRKGKV